ncbi:hypothetical protein GCM10023215_22020 [Pseudonocardia yuanmonensis]|uniref:Uncharacterized protein n=1 Tax=Pseudonocardia yuanmonensis TaxID=1095914 RepID=A0ABP8WBM7_9PSEU
MSDRRTDPSWDDLDQGLLIGAVILLSVGALAGMSGSVLVGAAVLKATRRWMRRADLPPADLARLKWAQARAAAGAGAGAWRASEPAARPAVPVP